MILWTPGRSLLTYSRFPPAGSTSNPLDEPTMTNRLFRRLLTGGAMCLAATLAMAPARPARAADAPADPAAQLDTLTGFKVELVLKADKTANGSWISLGKDNKGPLLLGGQPRQPLTRVTVEDGKAAKQDVLKLPVSEIMCSLWAFDS